MDATTKLLPCPFCGGEAVEKVTGPAHSRKYEVVCSVCGCKTGKTVASPCHVRAWNARTPEIVRCADCAHFRAVRCVYSDFDRTVEFCNLTDLPMEREDFCSKAERRGDA